MSASHPPFPDPPPAKPPAPASEQVWAAARRSYVQGGCSSLVVAKRHGLNERTVRHHAQQEGWSGLRDAFLLARGGASSLDGAPQDPGGAAVAEANHDEAIGLLIEPTGDAFVLAAAKRAGEAILRDAPDETWRWLRAVREARAVSCWIDAARHRQPTTDLLRAAHINGVAEQAEALCAASAGSPEAGAVAGVAGVAGVAAFSSPASGECDPDAPPPA